MLARFQFDSEDVLGFRKLRVSCKESFRGELVILASPKKHHGSIYIQGKGRTGSIRMLGGPSPRMRAVFEPYTYSVKSLLGVK